MTIPIDDFAQQLSNIPESRFTHTAILDFLRSNPVDVASLSPYLYFCKEHYTRNLIHKTDVFELLAVCWEPGQKSPVHNHRDQSCWMALPYGKLQIHNFALVRKDCSKQFCELRSSGHFLLEPHSPQEVDPEEPIHEVANLPAFGSRAVSLHIYSRPFDTCEVYHLKEKRYEDVPLINTTEYGLPKLDWKLEHASLN